MPNRILKESICTSDEIDALNSDTECFFYRLIVNCDDFGLLDARPSILKSKCYPLKSIDINCIQMMLASLVQVGLIEVYEVSGKRYLHVKKWESHQQIRAKRAKYPLPNDGIEITCNQLISDDSNCTRNPIQSNPIQSESNPNPIPKKTSEQDPDKTQKHLSASADVIEVFDHWRTRMNHDRAMLDQKRTKLIKMALETGYTKADLIEAIDGCAKSPFHMGQNQDRKVYDGLDLILRDASKIDGFIKTNRVPIQLAGVGNEKNRFGHQPDNSAAGRVRAAIARERAEEAAAARNNSNPLADDVFDVWPQMGIVLRE